MWGLWLTAPLLGSLFDFELGFFESSLRIEEFVEAASRIEDFASVS